MYAIVYNCYNGYKANPIVASKTTVYMHAYVHTYICMYIYMYM